MNPQKKNSLPMMSENCFSTPRQSLLDLHYPLIFYKFSSLHSQSVIQIADPHPRSHTHQQCFETAMASFCPQIQPPFSVDTPLIKMSLKGCFLFFSLRRTQKAKSVTVVKMVYLRYGKLLAVCLHCPSH